MTDKEELREQASAISFWLAPENAEARRQLAERRSELGMWLDKVEAMVQQKLREVEKEEATMKL